MFHSSGPLVLRIPLAELVTEREHPLLGARLLLVAPCRRRSTAPNRCSSIASSSAVVCSRFLLAAPAGFLGHPAGVDGILHGRHDQPEPEFSDPAITEIDHLVEVVPGVHVHDREGDPRWPERLLGQPQHDDGVLAAGEKQHRPFELGRHLPHHVDRLGLEDVKL